DTEPGVAGAEVGDVDAGDPDDCAACGERAEHAQEQAAHQAGGSRIPEAVPDGAEHGGPGHLVRTVGGGDGQSGDDDCGDEEGDAVDVEGDVGFGGLQDREEAAEHRAEGGQQRGQSGSDGGGTVGGEQAELVGLFQAVPGHQVGHGGVLGGRPEQGHAFGEEVGDEQPVQAAHDGDRNVEQAADNVAHDHGEAAGEPVG